MKKLIPILLIIGGLSLGFFGFEKLDNSDASVSIGNLELSAESEGDKEQAYLMIGLGLISLIGGVYLMKK